MGGAVWRVVGGAVTSRGVCRLRLRPLVQGGGASEAPCIVLSGQTAEGGGADGGVGWGVDVNLDLRTAGSIADASAYLCAAGLRVGQVVEAGEGIRQQAHVGTAETEAPPLRTPLARYQPRPLLGCPLLVADWLVGVEVRLPGRLQGRPHQEAQQGQRQRGQQQQQVQGHRHRHAEGRERAGVL